MSIISWPFILAIFSGSGVILFLGWRFYCIRNFKKKKLYEGIISNQPFFWDFEKSLEVIAEVIAEFLIKILVFLKKQFEKKKNFIQGRHVTKNNGCLSGYWNKLNECKNNKK